MQCSSYCTGELYDLKLISEFCKKNNHQYSLYGKDVLHITSNSGFVQDVDVFVYYYGCIVMWGITNVNTELFIIEKLKTFLSKPIAFPIIDRCNYSTVDVLETCIDAESDEIRIKSEDSFKEDAYLKLSFSYGLSQSVKLSVFEESVEKTIAENRSIPYKLIKTGKISLSKKELAKKIGVLFLERDFINLNSDILDTPDFFWKRPRYEPFYEMSIKFFDIKQRIDILNGRLNIIHELYEIIYSELRHVHSSRLELIIICLILIEVIMVLLKEVVTLEIITKLFKLFNF